MQRVSVILILLLVSCKKESNTYSDTFFTNTTSHTIKVNSFINGAIIKNTSFELGPNEKKKVFYNSTRGINKGDCYGYINMPVDSFLVTFDNTLSMVHYKDYLIGTNPKRYLYQSPRNIYNESNYTLTVRKQSETEKFVEYNYVFSENDYIDAQ